MIWFLTYVCEQEEAPQKRPLTQQSQLQGQITVAIKEVEF